MYTHQLCLTGLHSNYLVYLSSLDLDSNTTSKNSDDMVNTAVSSESTPSRRTWLLNQAETAGTFSTEDRVYPASPHAMYRLADKLDIPDVKELAKRAILDGFTVENVRIFFGFKGLSSRAQPTFTSEGPLRAHINVLLPLCRNPRSCSRFLSRSLRSSLSTQSVHTSNS